MFFQYRIYDTVSKPMSISSDTELACEGLAYRDYIESSLSRAFGNGSPVSRIEWKLGFTPSVKKRIGKKLKKSDEAYAIYIGTTTKVYAESENGFVFAASTLASLSSSGELKEGFLYDSPFCEYRIFRCFLPSRAGTQDFFRFVDFLATYKFNTIVLEIGGSMEYDRHPEINKVWVEFCRDMRRYSGRTKEIQFKTYPWPKNSIHCDNAEGDILTQDECRRIAEYCRSRGLNVIPAVQLLSHSDYIVMAHPELREREKDMHPDTYCPNHPDVYKYVYDILEEVIDVFNPKRIHIGHDEVYSIGICPRCKGIPPYKIYADHIRKIHGYLAERGIKTMISGEKLLNAHYGREAIGGAGHGKGEAKVPALWPCRDLIPKDILISHWYWKFNEDYDNVYIERGIKAVFGNCNALAINHFSARCRRGICGGMIGNWGSFADDYMQRNQQYLSILASSYAFFCDDIDRLNKTELLKHCFEEGYRYCVSRTSHPLEITHTTTFSIPFEWAWDGVFLPDEKYLIGNYELTYTDGTVASLPVRYGSHLGCADTEKALGNSEFLQLVYRVLPILHNGKYAFKAIYEDPHPEKTLSSVRYLPLEKFSDVSVELIAFSRHVPKTAKAEIKGCSDAEFGADVIGIQEI